ncbi:MAG: DegV family protein [Anaerolineae bacterium]|nr:MAG: DegV family protein [Anaerolineae bacterium]
MAKKVAIVTDSTAYIPEEWIKKYHVKIAPAVVIWDGEELRDLFDILPNDFFKRLSSSSTMPTTSQPSPAAVKACYEELVGEGYDILGIYVSSKLSGTLASAEQAKSMMPNANIMHLDTLAVSMGAGWAIMMAGEAALAGKSLAECHATASEAIKHVGVYITPDTLEFLHRGGRIGGAQRFLGTALSLKPLLYLHEGRLEPLERVRTRKKALARLAELVVEQIKGKSPVYVAAIHANAAEEAQELLNLVTSAVPANQTLITFVSPAVGTHTGPGTVGIAFMAGYGGK